MSRIKRYELYEDDGEVIGAENFRPAESEGTSEPGARRAGNASRVPQGETQRGKSTTGRRFRYFSENEEEDGLGAPPSLFDDLQRFQAPAPALPPARKKKKLRHPGAWIACILFSCLGILICGWILIPQLTGSAFRFLPNIAFANGTILKYGREQDQLLHACIRELDTETIYPGIYIDSLHLGGMTREEAEAALTERADMSGADFDITVTVGNQSWHVTPERVPVSRNIRQLVNQAWTLGRGNTPGLRGTGKTPFQERVDRASELRSFPVSLNTEKSFDHTALRELCEGISNYVNRDPVNSTVATFDFGTKEFTFTEDRPGAYLAADEIYQKVSAMLEDGNYFNSLFLTPEKRIADVTRTELINSFGLISSYTTSTTSNRNRNNNIQLSAQAINGLTVLPGEVFSFNAATGERTAEKGYKPAAAISGGQSKDEIGGGVCQTSSTLFNAVARANLEIVERSPHAWPSNYVEKGFDATVNWPGLDFKFKNNTDWPVFLTAAYRDRKVSVSVYGMRLEADTTIELESDVVRTIPQPEGTNYVINTALKQGESQKTVTGRKGYVVDTWKVWFQAGKEIRREKLFTSNYKAYQETIEYNPY